MTTSLTPALLERMLSHAAAALQTQRAALNELDAATGDGDHGTAIVAAYNAAHQAAQSGVAGSARGSASGSASGSGPSFAAMLEKIGWDVMTATSGSTSTLTGSFYVGMATAATTEALDVDATIAAFEAGLANIQKSTKAGVGDKTLMDALIPAIAAMMSLRGASVTLATLLVVAAEAAEAGAATTKDLVAKHGRARNLGERSKGHLDAGAASTAVIYRAFAEAVADAMA